MWRCHKMVTFSSLFNISMLFLVHSSLLINWLIYSWSSSNLSLDRHNNKIFLCVAVKGNSSCIISDSRCHGLRCKTKLSPYLYMYQNCVTHATMKQSELKFFSLTPGFIWNISLWTDNYVPVIGPHQPRSIDRHNIFYGWRWKEKFFRL